MKDKTPRIRTKTPDEIQRAIPHQLTKGLKALREEATPLQMRDAGILKTKEGQLVQVFVVVATFLPSKLRDDPDSCGLPACENGEIVLTINEKD